MNPNKAHDEALFRELEMEHTQKVVLLTRQFNERMTELETRFNRTHLWEFSKRSSLQQAMRDVKKSISDQIADEVYAYQIRLIANGFTGARALRKTFIVKHHLYFESSYQSDEYEVYDISEPRQPVRENNVWYSEIPILALEAEAGGEPMT